MMMLLMMMMMMMIMDNDGKLNVRAVFFMIIFKPKKIIKC